MKISDIDLGDRLTEVCKGFAEIDLYDGDDGLLYFAGTEPGARDAVGEFASTQPVAV